MPPGDWRAEDGLPGNVTLSSSRQGFLRDGWGARGPVHKGEDTDQAWVVVGSSQSLMTA